MDEGAAEHLARVIAARDVLRDELFAFRRYISRRPLDANSNRLLYGVEGATAALNDVLRVIEIKVRWPGGVPDPEEPLPPGTRVET
jgi:hypothetical protein